MSFIYREVSLARNLQELEVSQAIYDERCEELAQVHENKANSNNNLIIYEMISNCQITKELKEQEKKLARAEKTK